MVDDELGIADKRPGGTAVDSPAIYRWVPGGKIKSRSDWVSYCRFSAVPSEPKSKDPLNPPMNRWAIDRCPSGDTELIRAN